MKKLLFVILFCIIGIEVTAQDLISGGSNSWRFHTPDDGRTLLHIAPYTNGDWDWSVSTKILNTGDIIPGGQLQLQNGDLVQTGTFNIETQNNIKLGNYLLFDADGDFTGGNYFTIQDDASGDFLRLGRGFQNNLVIANNGYIGIGTTTPTEQLDVNGRIRSDYLRVDAVSSSEGGEIMLAGPASHNDWRIDNRLGAFRLHHSGTTYFQVNADGEVISNGKMRIGASELGPHQLAVEGSVGARKIVVKPTGGWSDFVFATDYQLPTLDEVEEFIETNKHLPDIPSESEVYENGIDVGAMNAKLLQKIEELTLYMIDLNKKVEQLDEENRQLRSELNIIKASK